MESKRAVAADSVQGTLGLECADVAGELFGACDKQQSGQLSATSDGQRIRAVESPLSLGATGSDSLASIVKETRPPER